MRLKGWDDAKALLEPALEDTHTIEDVWSAIEADRAHLWQFGDSAVVTQFVQYPRVKVLRVWLAGGNLDDMLRGLPVLDEVARDFGCGRIEIEGRKGWARVLNGFKERSVVLSKDV